jgi:ATP phosphoribosyltransferase
VVKPFDVAVYVESGAADLGVTGTDVLRESETDVLEPIELGFGACRLVVASPAAGRWPYLPGGRTARVATKYPRLAWRHFAERGQPVEDRGQWLGGGRATAGPLPLDRGLVDTGDTLRANGLVERKRCCRWERS